MNTQTDTFAGNEAFLQALTHGDAETFNKIASQGGTSMTRKQLRENGLQRKYILPFESTEGQTFHYDDTDDDLPYIIAEAEQSQAPAITVGYNGVGELRPMKASRYRVLFHRNITPKFEKHVAEFICYKSDIKALTINNALLDLQTQEDANWFRVIDAGCGAENAAMADGFKRYRSTTGGVTRANWNTATQHFYSFALNPGIYVVNRVTWARIQDWKRDEFGGDAAEKILREGIAALGEFKPFGVPHAVTIKGDIIPNNQIYMFAPTNFLGKAFEMEPTKVTVKKEDDIVRVQGSETVGFAIANANAIGRWKFGA